MNFDQPFVTAELLAAMKAGASALREQSSSAENDMNSETEPHSETVQRLIRTAIERNYNYADVITGWIERNEPKLSPARR